MNKTNKIPTRKSVKYNCVVCNKNDRTHHFGEDDHNIITCNVCGYVEDYTTPNKEGDRCWICHTRLKIMKSNGET